MEVDVSLAETSWLHILMLCCEGFYYHYLSGILHMTLNNIVIFKGNLGDWQPKIIVFNKSCKIESLRV